MENPYKELLTSNIKEESRQILTKRKSRDDPDDRDGDTIDDKTAATHKSIPTSSPAASSVAIRNPESAISTVNSISDVLGALDSLSRHITNNK